MLQDTKVLTKHFKRQYHASRPLFADNNAPEDNQGQLANHRFDPQITSIIREFLGGHT